MWRWHVSIDQELGNPKKPSDILSEDLIKILRDHSHPRHTKIVHCFDFDTGVSQPNATITTTVIEFRKKIEFCRNKFDDIRRDVIVCGINHPKMNRHLLSEANVW